MTWNSFTRSPGRHSGSKMVAPSFSFDTFLARSGLALHDYMEPLLADRQFRPELGTAEAMLARLDQYDHYHLVYALLAGFRVIPEKIAPLLPTFLTHAKSSVCATAINLLNELNPKLITKNLIARVRHASIERTDLAFLPGLAARLDSRSRERPGV
jgi:hypothetical protein